MHAFLEGLYVRNQSDELGALLGGMSLLKNGGTADPAAWHDWEEAARKVCQGEVEPGLRLRGDDA